MRIRLNSLYAGPAGIIQPGQEVDMPEAVAAALVNGGYAVALDAPPEPEAAVDTPPAKAKPAKAKPAA